MDPTLSFLIPLIEKMATIFLIMYLFTRWKDVWTIQSSKSKWQQVVFFSLVFGLLYFFGYVRWVETIDFYFDLCNLGPQIAGLIGGPWAGTGAAITGLFLQRISGSPVQPEEIIIQVSNGLICGIIYIINGRKLINLYTAWIVGILIITYDYTIDWIFYPDVGDFTKTSFFLFLGDMIIIAASLTLFVFLIQNVRHEYDRITTVAQLEGQLAAARDIQSQFLPHPEDNKDDTLISALLEPMYEVGGDFYDYRFLDKTRLYFCIGDVAGKGVPAALIMAATVTLLRNTLFISEEPEKMLYEVNNSLIRIGREVKFVTLSIGILDLTTGRIQFANAGHLPPILVRQEKPAVYSIQTNIPAGSWEHYPYIQEEILLNPGDQIIFYSDGITEAEYKNQQFGTSKIITTLEKNRPHSPHDTIQVVKDAVYSFTHAEPLTDDMTIVVIRYSGDKDLKRIHNLNK